MLAILYIGRKLYLFETKCMYIVLCTRKSRNLELFPVVSIFGMLIYLSLRYNWSTMTKTNEYS